MQKIQKIDELIEVEEPTHAPHMVFFAVKHPKGHSAEGDIEILSYVLTAALSKSLRDAIRSELRDIVKPK